MYLCFVIILSVYLTKYKGIDVYISAITMDFFDQKSWLFSATINDDDIGYLNGSTVDIMESVQLASTLPLGINGLDTTTTQIFVK